jgi:hypothetical protein
MGPIQGIIPEDPYKKHPAGDPIQMTPPWTPLGDTIQRTIPEDLYRGTLQVTLSK